MLDIIKKTEYWKCLDDKRAFQLLGGFSMKALDGLKHIQDAWMFNELKQVENSKILEIGGANSRVLPLLQDSNEKWNLDEFKGAGNGPLDIIEMSDVKLIKSNMGEFSDELPDNYFDLVFSISVIEHVPEKYHEKFWRDQVRIMKQGAMNVHVIDLYIGDNINLELEKKVALYQSLPSKLGLVLKNPVTLQLPITFRCDMASNSDWGMWRWNKIAPTLVKTREKSQSVSLALILIKE